MFDFLNYFKLFVDLFSPATWFLLISVLTFISMIVKETHNPNSPLDWREMLIDPVNRKMSVSKFGQMVGIIIGSWVVIDIVDAKHNIGIDVFGAYLLFIVGAYGVNVIKPALPTPPTLPDAPPAAGKPPADQG
jgi:hypothetical protein